MSITPMADSEYLARYSGVPPASPAQLADMEARSRAREQSALDASLTVEQTATLLNSDIDAVHALAARGGLLAYDGPDGALLLPDWQFTNAGDLVPHLAAVLAAMPRTATAVATRVFMTRRTHDLATDPDRPFRATSPVEWLTAGNDPDLVVRLAATLGEQV